MFNECVLIHRTVAPHLLGSHVFAIRILRSRTVAVRWRRFWFLRGSQNRFATKLNVGLDYV